MAEAGMFPGLVTQLASWYRSDEMGKPIMWMFAFQNTSGVVGSLLAYGLVSKFVNWKVSIANFILEYRT
jgi:MFS family permease